MRTESYLHAKTLTLQASAGCCYASYCRGSGSTDRNGQVDSGRGQPGGAEPATVPFTWITSVPDSTCNMTSLKSVGRARANMEVLKPTSLVVKSSVPRLSIGWPLSSLGIGLWQSSFVTQRRFE